MIKQYSYEKLNEMWVEESAERKDSMEMLVIKLREILEEYYNELYDFFIDIMEADYDYKFLIARRCLVLYQIFMQIFEYEGKDVQVRGKILSDRSIPKMDMLMEDKKILLIDDILIHGRRVGDLYKEFTSHFQCASVNVRVYMATDDGKCINREIISNIQYTEIAEGWKWKTLSDAIARTIYVSNIPYTSFVPAIILENAEEFIQESSGLECEDNTSLEQLSEQCHSRVFFSKMPRPNLFHILSHKECVREYRSEIRNNILLIPYSFTRSVRADKIDAFFDAVVKHIGNLLPKICAEMSMKKEDSGWNSYRLCLLNALLSQLTGAYFFERDFEKFQDYDTLAKSFGEEISIEFLSISYEKAKIILDDSYEELKQYICRSFRDEPALTEVYGQKVLSCEDVERGYWSYLAANRKIDEERAEKNLKRLFGLSVDHVFNNCKDDETVKKMALYLLSSMDTGCAAVSYKIADNREAYASIIMTGELSFRILLQRYAEIIRNMISLEEKHADINEYIFYLHEKGVINDDQKNELEVFYQDNAGDLENCNVVAIIENRSFWGIPKVTEEHNNYFKEKVLSN